VTFASWLISRAARRAPDFIVGGADDPYLRRWWLIPRNRWCNVYLHHFLRSDDDRALHDHPWINCSILLRGLYREHTPAGSHIRARGDVVFRLPTSAHRIELSDGPVWTLFLTGPRVREWGFLCPQGWIHWKRFVADSDRGSVGKGCDQ
jgi:hypothetical protein